MAVDVGGPRHGGRRLRIDDGGGQARLLVLEVHVDGLGVILPAHVMALIKNSIYGTETVPVALLDAAPCSLVARGARVARGPVGLAALARPA